MQRANRDDRRAGNSTATAHGIGKYLPLPESERKGTALCLSGGGYRATLFDLGAMRRLNELGILSQIDTITSVSGGSIAGAFVSAHVADALAGNWPAPGKIVPAFDEGIADRVRALARRNIRTGAAMTRLNPLNLRNPNAASDELAEQYGEFITSTRVASLPGRPRFVFCATDLTFRTQWVVDSGLNRLGSEIVGYQSPVPPEWTVARAVAASSCFPGVFPPMRLDFEPGDYAGGTLQGVDGVDLRQRIEISDGGVYDNLGLEPVWADHAVVLVSDASPSYGPSPDLGPFWPSIRPVVTLLEQATIVRKRWLISNFIEGSLTGAYWGIASLPSRYDPDPGVVAYPDRLIEQTISQVRIELDAFSDAEMAVLENHGYLMCDVAIRTHLPELIAIPGATMQPPHPEWMDSGKVETALKDSHRHRILGRGAWR